MSREYSVGHAHDTIAIGAPGEGVCLLFDISKSGFAAAPAALLNRVKQRRLRKK
jgi:hypothetical protein